jgi:Pyruvate/2-oxoacid:ferredoxin oxidoreductase delta subunit/coenzyme F420-reducing hydrogenase delta subunit
VTFKLLAAADAFCNRLYGQRFNPLYQSGTIAVALYLVLALTGVWLLLFYRVGAPWESVSRITADPWMGNWVRGVHRYASDLALVATLVHAFRMFAERRSWGPRALAWCTGVILTGLLLFCGWTGYVMVWDTFGQALARDGARMLDALPFLSEPTGRAFTGEQPLPTAFFFLNLFAHVGIPLGMGVAFLLHVKHLARPLLLPPRPILWLTVATVVAMAVLAPLTMAPRADPFVLAPEVTADVFFAFWMPITRRLDGGTALLLAGAVTLGLLAVPAVMARLARGSRPPSMVDEEVCVECVQCTLDCPYGAITMVERTGPRTDLVARVSPDLCVSCGICAGSCAPMGIGPPGRTGRDQLAEVRRFMAAPERRTGEIVVVCCEHGAGALASTLTSAGAVPYPIDCAGNLHSSVVELLVRGGSGGVLVASCPPRDCWNREGPKWLHERIYEGRAAELQARVPRARVAIATLDSRDRSGAVATVQALAAQVASLGVPAVDDAADSAPACEAVLVERG